MKVLVIGSGGREHAICWGISNNKKIDKIYCAPGNAGISNIAEIVNIKTDNLEGLVNFAKKENIDFTIVGPEQPLSLGIVDLFRENNLLVFGPSKYASQLESSKEFSKLFELTLRKKLLVNLADLDGIGETQIQSIDSFFSSNTNTRIVKELIENLDIKNFSTENKDGKFSNKKLMFTGGFENMSRSEAKTIVENNGGKVLGTISKKLNFLVVGQSKPTKSKIDQAKKLNIKIILEKEWNKILNS